MGYVPDFAGAHSQGASLDELQRNLREVIEMLLEDGEPALEAEFVGTQSITVAAQLRSKPPVLKPRETCRILESPGFARVRQRGSHLQ